MSPRRRRAVLLRDLEGTGAIEAFLVAAVSAVLAVRLFLHLAGYPQIGGSRLHVAHLLWGGLLMGGGFLLALGFIGRAADRLAAVIGGIGFGLFVDEVGKFVTRDHDYFYRPAVALIYVAFMLLFLAHHVTHRRRALTPEEYLLNALRDLEELAVHDMDPTERARALERLDAADPAHPLVGALRAALADVPLVERPRPSRWTRARAAARRGYERLVRLRGFERALVLFFVGQLLAKLAFGTLLFFVLGLGWERALDFALVGGALARARGLAAPELAQIAASALSAGFVAIGVVRLRRSREAAYRAFERAILVSILLVQPFGFYHDQFAALLELGFNVAVLAALRAMLRLERERSSSPGAYIAAAQAPAEGGAT